MRYGVPTLSEALKAAPCCFIGEPIANGGNAGWPCGEKATWNITYGASPDDTTLSCDEHVAALLGDDPCLDINRIQEPTVDHLDIVFSGPPGPNMDVPRYIKEALDRSDACGYFADTPEQVGWFACADYIKKALFGVPQPCEFVEVEGFYGSLPPSKIEGTGAGEWITDGDLWRLRIPIPAGWLHG